MMKTVGDKLIFFNNVYHNCFTAGFLNAAHFSIKARYILLTILYVLLSLQSVKTFGDDGVIAKRFKEYLATPPTVRSVIFKRKYTGFLPPELAEEGFKKNEYALYFGKWQKNAFFSKMIANPEDGETGKSLGMFTGENEGKRWIIENGLLKYQPENASPRGAVPSSVDRVQAIGRSFLSVCIHMGIPNLLAGSLVWDGNEFSGASIEGKSIMGRLIISKDKYPSQLNFRYSDEKRTYNVEYEFAKNNKDNFLPTIIRRDNDEFEILDIDLHYKLLPLEEFGPEKFAVDGYKSSLMISNNITYYTNRHGRFIAIDTESAVRKTNPKLKPLIFGFIFITSIITWYYYKNKRT